MYGLPYWITNEQAREYSPEETEQMVAAIRERFDRMRRQWRTTQILEYCRHMDSPARFAELADILKRHPQWQHPDANWWD